MRLGLKTVQPPGSVAIFAWLMSNGQLCPRKKFFPLIAVDMLDLAPEVIDAWYLDQTLADMPINTLCKLYPARGMPVEAKMELPPAEPDPEMEGPTRAPLTEQIANPTP